MWLVLLPTPEDLLWPLDRISYIICKAERKMKCMRSRTEQKIGNREQEGRSFANGKTIKSWREGRRKS